jgi:hypothetical protein
VLGIFLGLGFVAVLALQAREETRHLVAAAALVGLVGLNVDDRFGNLEVGESIGESKHSNSQGTKKWTA